MTLSTGIGGGIFHDGDIWRGADSYAGEIGHSPSGPTARMPVRRARLLRADVLRAVAGARLWQASAKELMADPGFVRRYVVDLALGLKACIMLLNPARIVIGGGIGKAGDAAVRSAAGRAAAADHELVGGAHRCGAGGTGRR